MNAYKNRDYEQALIETFLNFDDILKTKKVNEMLKKFEKNQLSEKQEFEMQISFNYLKDEYILNEFPCKSVSLDIAADKGSLSDKRSSSK